MDLKQTEKIGMLLVVKKYGNDGTMTLRSELAEAGFKQMDIKNGLDWLTGQRYIHMLGSGGRAGYKYELTTLGHRWLNENPLPEDEPEEDKRLDEPHEPGPMTNHPVPNFVVVEPRKIERIMDTAPPPPRPKWQRRRPQWYRNLRIRSRPGLYERRSIARPRRELLAANLPMP